MSIDLKKLLLYGTLFVAPAGMFYTPVAAVGSLRVFYFGCLLINLYAIVRMRWVQLQELAMLIFLLALIMASAGYGLLVFQPHIEGAAENPVVRVLVIGNLMFGFYFIGHFITELSQEVSVVRILDRSFYGFITVFFLGLALYLLVIRGVVPATVYAHFVSLEQTGYGYLRLSPGTYPNEFGVLCSFFAVYAFISYGYERRLWVVPIAFCFVLGIFLTSTRTAYITFFVGALTLFVLHPSFWFKARLFFMGLIGAGVVVGGLKLIGFNVIQVIVSGFQAALNTNEGSVATRQQTWTAAIENFNYVPGLGVGFESPDASFLHNLPLQLLYGLGIWGLAVMLVLFGIFFASLERRAGGRVADQSARDMAQFRMIRLVLAEHVVLFGLTNHNQAHFLTWLLFALFICNLRVSDEEDEIDTETDTEEVVNSGMPRAADAPSRTGHIGLSTS